MEDLHQFVANIVTDRIIFLNPDCEPYRTIILQTVSGFGDDELPRLHERAIDDFIESDFQHYIATKAADVLTNNVAIDDKYFSCSYYLEFHYPICDIAKIISGDKQAIAKAKTDIDGEQDEGEKFFEESEKQIPTAEEPNQDMPEQDVLLYADEFGYDALGVAICGMIEDGELYFTEMQSMRIWDYGGKKC